MEENVAPDSSTSSALRSCIPGLVVVQYIPCRFEGVGQPVHRVRLAISEVLLLFDVLSAVNAFDEDRSGREVRVAVTEISPDLLRQFFYRLELEWSSTLVFSS